MVDFFPLCSGPDGWHVEGPLLADQGGVPEAAQEAGGVGQGRGDGSAAGARACGLRVPSGRKGAGAGTNALSGVA